MCILFLRLISESAIKYEETDFIYLYPDPIRSDRILESKIILVELKYPAKILLTYYL